MAKNKSNSVGTLASYWCPPASVVDGVGEPVACLASTFEFDAAFFEAELLPRFLGLKFDHTENEVAFLIEREEKLALTNTAILVDIHKVDPRQSTLRWDQIPIAVRGAKSTQHSKIVLLIWERLARLIVGSANITSTGYRRNREVFAALDFWNDAESVPRRPVDEALDLLHRVLEWSRVPVATRERIAATISDIRARLAGWERLPQDFRPREKPRVKFVATSPTSGDHPARSALDQVLTEWGTRSVSELTVFTPFVGEPSGEGDKVCERLGSVPRTRDCVGFLVVPRRPANESDSVVQVPLPKSFGNAWLQAFDSRGGGRIIAVPQFVKRFDKVNREFHSKLLSLDDGDRQLLLIGSSNFTPHGMGIGVFNVEANLLFDSADDMLARIEIPVDWDDWSSVDQVQWDDNYETSKDTLDDNLTLPKFFAWASYSQVTGILQVAFNRSCPEPPSWFIRLKGTETEELTLFERAAGGASDTLTHTFPEGSRTASLSAVLVEWTDEEKQLRSAPLIVSIQSRDDLSASELFKPFGVDAMLDCLIRGQSLAEWQEQQLHKKEVGIGINAAFESLRYIDTSEFMLYRVRRFGRALSGLCERIERTVVLPTAVHYRLFKDPLGPVSLTEAIAISDRSIVGSFAALSEEHRLFLLAELLLAVAHVTHRMLHKADESSEAWLTLIIRDAAAEIAKKVQLQKIRIRSGLAKNMDNYVTQVLDHTASLVGPIPMETVNAS